MNRPIRRPSEGPGRLLLAAALTLLSAAAAHAASPAAPDAWRSAPFSLGAGALLKLAEADAPGEDASALVLLSEANVSFDAAGRRTTRYRLVFRILQASAVEEWSSVEAGWSPWHEARPEIRARVVTKEGAEHILDSKTIAEEGASEGSPDVYGDRRILRAPLPAVAVGSVVEQEIVERETSPILDAGEVDIFEFGSAAPVQRTRLTLSFPQALSLRTRSYGRAPAAPGREETAQGVRLTFESGLLEPQHDFEPGVPSDAPQGSFVAYTTGKSWEKVAERYAEIVDKQVAGADLKAAVQEAAGGVGDRAQLAARLVAWLERRVRYTGVEFSDASIVPRPPAETLKRKYGDCKDKAALLVALLRAAGVPASVAILKTGPGPDVDPDLPGFGRFDHAIVYAPGAPPLWIDPTDEFARAGELPTSDQDRLVLVAQPGTSALLRTPASTSADNRTVETREFFLPERGRARVVEITTASGGPERSLRRSYAGTDKKRAQEDAEAYARAEYLARGAVRLKYSDGSDLNKPFEVRVEVEDAGRGATDDNGAAAAIRLDSLLAYLPAVIRSESAEENDEGPPAATAKPRKKRVRDYVFREPFTIEWRYRFVPPPGYKAAPLPPSRVEALGTASMALEFAMERDGAVAGRLKLDSGKRRLSPQEFETMRAAALRLAKSEPIFVRFESVGQAHLEAGRIREALAEFRRLAALHANEGLHRSEVAVALLEGGLGEAAREEARKATAVEPKSAFAWRIQGWVLQHDLLGRRFRPGFDLAGAVSAYRKARELDANDLIVRGDLAILLEHDSEGQRYSARADLKGAIDEYQAIRRDLKSKAFEVNLCTALYRAGRFGELAETARQIEPSPTRDQFLILAAAATGGAESGLREGARLVLDPGKRREAYDAVGRTLAQLRLYPQAAVLLAESANGAGNAAQIRALSDILKKTRRHEEMTFADDDPQSVVPRFLVALFTATPKDQKAIFSLFARASVAELLPDKGDARSGFDDIMRLARDRTQQTGASLDFALDAGLAAIRQAVEGDGDSGWRVRVTGAPGLGQTEEVFYLVREDGKPRILTSDRAIGILGLEALDRAERGDVDGARRWLDWAREELPGYGGDDPFSGSPFSKLWTKGAGADREKARAAAAALIAMESAADRALPILLQARQSAAEADRGSLDLAIARTYLRQKKYGDMLGPASRLAEARPESQTAFDLVQIALWGLGRTGDARKAAEERLKRLPDDRPALRALVGLASAERNYREAERWGRQILEKGSSVSLDLNNIAWNALFLPPVTDQAIDDARRAVDLTKETNSASLHTLAALYAEVGKTSEAKELLFKAMDARASDEPDRDDWYVLGRIAEQYAEGAAALAAYRKVTKPKDERDVGHSTWLLAQQRLAALGVTSPKPKP